MHFLFLAIELNNFPQRRSPSTRKHFNLPITDGFRNSIPTIAYKRNPNGITLFWQKKSQAITDLVKNYQIFVDGDQFGELIGPNDEPKFQINLSPGKHECYVEVISKDNNDEIFRSNVLKVDIAATRNDLRPVPTRPIEPSDTPVDRILEQKDLPIPKLSVQTISASSIRITWYLDRPLPTEAFVAMYDIHIRGQDFPENMTSDEHSEQDGYIEHIWHVQNSPLEITGISERQEYVVFIRAAFHTGESNDKNYVITTSNQVTTARVDPLIDLLTRPLLKVTRVGLQMTNLSWKLDDSVDQSLVKGYRIIVNSKPTEILSPNQHEYELRNLKPDTSNEIQVSVTSHRDFVDEKISEPIRIVCPQRPRPPTVQAIKADKPFSIGIKWKLEHNDQDEISSFKIFLDGKLHDEIETNGRQSFKYDFNKLQADNTYSIYVKALIGQKKRDGYVYQCDVESNASNELLLKCAAPPKGTTPRIERMHPNGVDIVWDAPVEYGDVKLTGYQILKNGRAIGKLLPLDKRNTSVNDLEIGNRYYLQVVPITDQPGGTLFRTGEEYDPDRHGHYIPGPKLEVEYTDLIELPTKFWVENISGHSAVVCWSPIDQSSSTNIQPDGYKLSIWNDKELTRDKPMVVSLTKDKTAAQLKDLQSETTYEIQLEVYKKRRHQITEDSYLVSTISEIVTFETGSPPDAPSNIHLIACTNTDVRISFDQFIEHNAEIKALRVQCEPISSEINAKEITDILTPDATEFTLTNLIQRTDYNVTIYGVTDEYLNENRYRDVSQLPKKLKPSKWLPNQSLKFRTSGYEPASQIHIHQANMELIELEWTLPKVYGSTQCIGQILRWKLEHGEEHSLELNQKISKATIPGPLPSGVYKLSLDSLFSVKISLEDDSDEASRKEIHSTISESVTIRFHTPASCERPELYLTGYTINTIDLSWNKPDMFNIIDHPEKINEQLKIHRRLIGYRIDINGRKHNTLEEDQYRCTLTECQPGAEYKVQLVAQTAVQNEYTNELVNNGEQNTDEPAETSSKKLAIRMLKNQDLLRSFQANFEFNPNEPTENNAEQKTENKSLGKITINWTVSDTKNISHFILQWHSSKDLRIQQKTVASNETSSIIDSVDEKHHYVIEIIIVTNDGNRYQYEQLTIPIPGQPDPPKLWLVKTSDTSFIVEWSEPKSYGIPVIGYQLYVAGKKSGDIIEVNLRRAEIPSRINRTYQVNVCAVTNNPQRTHSIKSHTLSVITTPTTDLIPTMYYNNDDGNSTTFDRTIARIIPLQIESINEEKLHLDWTSFLPTTAIRAYYIHYTCLNNGEVQTMKISKRFRHAVLRGLRPGFTYGIMIMAVDKNGGVLYTSDKSTIQMNAPPNAPIVSISERTTNHVKLEWRPAPSYGDITVVGYKIYINDRLAAILAHDQLTYTLTNGKPCDTYTVHVQALSNEKSIVSPMSRGVHFAWPGIKPGAFKRIDDGQTGYIIVAWEHPQLEDETEKLKEFRLFSENMSTHSVRLHGEFDAAAHQATIYDLNNGKYLLWLEIKSEKFCVRSRPITVISGRLNSSVNRQISFDSPRCFYRKSQRFRSPVASTNTPPLRHIQYS